MKKMFLFLGLVVLASCSNTDDSTNDLKEKNVSLSSRLSGTMTVNCVNTVGPPNSAAVISWNLGKTIPFSEGAAYIQIIPRSGATSFTQYDVSIPYLGSPYSKNIIISDINPVGSVWESGGNIYIHAKEFDYRYIIFDLDSSDHVETIWKHNYFLN